MIIMLDAAVDDDDDAVMKASYVVYVCMKKSTSYLC
jgi:hypothetical protein